MLLRKRIQASDGRVRVSLLGLVAGILLQRFGPRLTGVADSALGAGLVDGTSVVLVALSMALGMSGAAALRRRG